MKFSSMDSDKNYFVQFPFILQKENIDFPSGNNLKMIILDLYCFNVV